MKRHAPFTRNRLSSSILWAATFALFISTLAVVPQTTKAQNRYSFKVTNNSKWEIHELYISSTEKQGWGKDLLGDYVLKPGYEYTIENIAPGEYGVKFVDEEGDECVLEDIKIFKNQSWSLTTAWLERCEGYR